MIVGVVEELTGGYRLAATVLLVAPIAVIVLAIVARNPVLPRAASEAD